MSSGYHFTIFVIRINSLFLHFPSSYFSSYFTKWCGLATENKDNRCRKQREIASLQSIILFYNSHKYRLYRNFCLLTFVMPNVSASPYSLVCFEEGILFAFSKGKPLSEKTKRNGNRYSCHLL